MRTKAEDITVCRKFIEVFEIAAKRKYPGNRSAPLKLVKDLQQQALIYHGMANMRQYSQGASFLPIPEPQEIIAVLIKIRGFRGFIFPNSENPRHGKDPITILGMDHHDIADIYLKAKAFIAIEEESERSEKMRKLNAKRHKPDYEAKALVWADLDSSPRFESAEKSADYYVSWLKERGYTYSHRIVARWIRERTNAPASPRKRLK